MSNQKVLQTYHHTVVNKFHIYNSLFLNLPFDKVHQVGVLLPLLTRECQAAYAKQQSPKQIIDAFLHTHLPDSSSKQQADVLFKFIQYIERQIVLFDAIEEAAFADNHSLSSEGGIQDLGQKSRILKLTEQLQKLMNSYQARIVLTAHPTQFYPGPVLGIITELSEAIQQDDLDQIELLLQQLGKTPLYKKIKPTPFDEAVSLTWYLENVFYDTVKSIHQSLQNSVFDGLQLPQKAFVELGFWPGGDRDGNPNVSAEITANVGRRLRTTLLKCYYRDLRKLKRRLTFHTVEQMVSNLEKTLYAGAYQQVVDESFTAKSMIEDLQQIKTCLIEKHQSLFVADVETLIQQVHCFGFHFASLDVRQDSRVIMGVLNDLRSSKPDFSHPIDDTLGSLQAIETIQKENGPKGAHRYIISNCQSEKHMLAVMDLMEHAEIDFPHNIDIVPLFETIDDLKQAPKIMSSLFTNPRYQQHLQQRQSIQTIMLGFSDGTKDGGYIAANWSILRAKEDLSEIANEHDIKVIFFDGRGGPPARGGGATHQFYASLSPKIQSHAIQLTIQGQTISSNFGNLQTAQYNLEQLFSAGLSNAMTLDSKPWSESAYSVFNSLSDISYNTYNKFKNHPSFVPYLEQVSTLKYYGQTNISSRPTKRNSDEKLNFEDLRAIPFVGAWSQLKQNVLGYYGVGTALKTLIDQGQLNELRHLYQTSGFFKTLMDNCMMSIAKSFMPLTAYLQDNEQFGPFWCLIKEEFERAKSALLQISEQQDVMQNQPLRRASIEIREQIVLPLLTIQQYALQKIDELKANGASAEEIEVYENMVTRSLYGNINASRNAV